MPYLVDGHNLIPKLGLRLESVDDELELVAILQEYTRLERRQAVSPRRTRGPNGVEVYFDGAPASHAGTSKHGSVTVHFVPQTSTADNAIRNRLNKMGKAAKNWTVVSSDRQVQADARAAQAGILSSEEFTKILKQAMNSRRVPKSEGAVSKDDVDEWLKLFGDDET